MEKRKLQDENEKDYLLAREGCPEKPEGEEGNPEPSKSFCGRLNQGESKRKLRGYLLALGVVLVCTLGTSSTQALDRSIPHSELNGLRFLAQFILTAPFVAAIDKCDVRIDRERIPWVLLSTVLFTCISYAFYGACYYLPLGVVNGLQYSLTVIFVFIFNCIINRGFSVFEISAAVLCVAGCLLVTQPAFIFGNISGFLANTSRPSPCRVGGDGNRSSSDELVVWNNETVYSFTVPSGTEETVSYVLIALSALMTSTNAQILNRKLHDLSICRFNFWTAVVGSTSSFLIMAATEVPTLPTVGVCQVLLFTHMVCAGSTYMLQSNAFQLISTLEAALVFTLMIPVAFALQYTGLPGLLVGHANTPEIVGAVAVFLGNLAMPVRSLVNKHK